MNRFLQALIALSGLCITGLLGWQSYVSERRQAEVAVEQARYALISLFSENLSAAVRDCNDTAMAIATKTAVILGDDYAEPDYQVFVADAETQYTACKLEEVAMTEQAQAPLGADGWALGDAPFEENEPAPSAPVQQQAPLAPPVGEYEQTVGVVGNLKVRSLEGISSKTVQTRSATEPTSADWFAVLASFQVGGEESYAAERFAAISEGIRRSGRSLDLRVYRTAISDHYVIVLAPESRSRDDARKLAAMARDFGWAKDAFVQDDRDWKRCEQTGSVEGLQAC